MQNWCYRFTLASWLVLAGALAFCSNCAVAQIVPDRTLPSNSSITTQDNIRIITGGTHAGSNLFHSFGEFSVPTGSTAYFNNRLDIQNIISRVTGKSISNIDGLIKANGTANLFFLNPNGIIFGRNAKLDIGGSFLATTANAIQFGNQGLFSASTPEASSSLLTVNPSALLFNQIAAASIQNNSVAPSGLDPSLTSTATGLRVPNGQSLLLVGGNVSMDGGGLYAFGGRVELGGVSGAGTVGLNANGTQFTLSFPDGAGRSDVLLNNGAEVNVRADNGGTIAINARSLDMLRQSSLQAGIADGLGAVNSKAGNIEVNAQAAINLKDASEIRNSVQLGGTGQSGDINIHAGSLSLTNGAEVTASTYGRGDGGNITITARNTVWADEIRNYNPSGVFSTVLSTGVGKGGRIDITTGSLFFTNGAVLLAATYGRGDAGSITINAQDTVLFDGVAKNGSFPSASGIYSSVIVPQTAVNGGNISPQTVGNAGDISISTGSLSVTNGAKLSTRTTYGQGNAGNITIAARDNVFFDGVGTRGASGAFSSPALEAVGKAGGISLSTGALNIRNGAQLSASNEGQGFTGEINIRSALIHLDNQGIIKAITTYGNGGNITLGIKDLLLLRRNSQISTTTGSAEAGGNGGNININAPNGFVVAVPGENSDITANAFTGSGGKVQIQTSGLFGIQQRSREDLVRQLGTNDPTKLDPQKLATNDITAISQTNPIASGVVNINTLNLDPSRGLINLPVEPQEPKLAQACQADVAQNQSEFIITGRGGIPPNPREVLRSNAVHVDWVALDSDAESRSTSVESQDAQQQRSSAIKSQNTNNVKNVDTEIVEAQGWVVDAKGDIFLVAQPSNAIPHSSSWLTPVACSH
ncbi:filamentous hemagglutinin N-terminal domain-containing protein [Brasilonema sp. CT11]|nr:filamentous hemagglutinin N-terminal domain-containing protein [Brasilonema sp. CT11]